MSAAEQISRITDLITSMEQRLSETERKLAEVDELMASMEQRLSETETELAIALQERDSRRSLEY